MRCPYCREEIHDQAVKCPHCQRLLVPKPGWQRRSEERVATQEVPLSSAAVGTARGSSQRETPSWSPSAEEPVRRSSADGGRRTPPTHQRRSGLAVFGVLLIVVGAAGIGYVAGRASSGGSVGFVSGDQERVVQLEELAEQRLQEIRRLQERLGDATSATPSPTERELLGALEACDQAFSVLIEREAALFGDPAALNGFIQVANRCLAPTGQEIEVPQ